MPAGSALRLCTPRAVRAVPRDDHSRGGRSWFACPSCLACSLPRLVGLLGLFNSPYPSRTPKLSQWSDRPRRVGLGPQLLFLSRGSLTVRDSVVGRRWGFILVWLPVQQLVCPLGRHSAHRLQGRPLIIACHLPAPRSKYFGHRCFLLCGPEWHPANDQ